jgi:probable O-glycosylation ligase (exosortase A-associated)
VKQFVFMVAMTLYGSVGVFVVNPFCGPFVYYLYAVLRPQFMWKWSEFMGARIEALPWSFCVAVPSIIAALIGLHGGKEDDPEHPHRLTGAHFAMLLFALWISITFVMAQHREVAWPWYLDYIKIFIMYFVSWFIIRTSKQVWILFLMVGIALAYIAYEVNFAYFATGKLSIYHNGYGGLDNNGAGLMLAMGVPVCWFCFEGLQRRWRWVFVLLIPTLIHAVLMTYSRGAMLSIIVIVPLVVLRSRHRLLLTGALVCFVLVALPTLAGPQIRARFMTMQDTEIDESANSRRKSWKAALNIAKDFPVFGVGVRNSNLYSQAYGADMEGRTIHSQYFQIIADNGFPGLGLYLLMLATGWLALRQPRALVKGRTDTEARRTQAMAAGLECSLAVYCFGSIFLSLEVFELPYLLLLMCAQLSAVQRGEPQEVSAAEPHADTELDYRSAFGEPCRPIATT